MSVDGGYRSYAGDDLVTGEGVFVEVPVASVPSRMASRAIDLLITAILAIVGFLTFGVLTARSSEAVATAVSIVLTVGLTVILPVIFETLTRGRSPGKYALGLVTVRDDGGPITLRHSAIRQLVGFVEFYLLGGSPAIIAAFIHPRAKRLGDMAAGTYVMSLRHKFQVTAPPEVPPALEHWVRAADIGPMPASLSIGTRQFLTRTGGLTQQSRQHLGQDLCAQVLQHVSPPPPPGVHAEWILRAVLAERRRRDLDRLQSEAIRTHRLMPPDPLG
ncbi:possible conserved membrane protein [Janibacter sp. HTCC2649]|uniref:RDD family protein n=1 Tax=Janibacter sp. HTCC2649 TaxID=313589 RepID=UPI0000670E4D|nr:RDD family protein [Janibacter sp. HTCC2649]EAP97422.1 possible conserved membrane protein [Janibacter sp. HTCC2649]